MEEFDTVEAPRGATSREWEVFCRETNADPLTHVGSVSAPSAAIAREQATQLFGHAAETLWLCPADETVRLKRKGVGVGAGGDEQSATNADPTMDESTMQAETLRGENG
jgi:rSAM-partnered protein